MSLCVIMSFYLVHSLWAGKQFALSFVFLFHRHQHIPLLQQNVPGGKEELIIMVCTSNNIFKTLNIRKVNHPFIQVPNGDGHFFQTLILNKEQ